MAKAKKYPKFHEFASEMERVWVSKAKPGEIYEVVHKEIVQQRKIKVVKRVGKAINRRWQDSYRRFRVRTGQLDRYEKIQEV